MKKSFLLIALFFHLFLFGQDELKPTPTEASVTVNVTDTQNKPREGQSVTFVNKKTTKSYSGVTKADGKFKILIPKDATYLVKYKSISNDINYSEIVLPLAKDTLLNFNLKIEFELPKIYTLDNVFFDKGKATLRPESFKELNELVEFMTLKSSLEIEIAGHTDNQGTKEGNQKLSEDRANSVRTYLINKGVSAARIVAKGYGDSQPVASNDDEVGRQKNRRTEVRILKQ